MNPTQVKKGDSITVSAKISADPAKIGSVVFNFCGSHINLSDPDGNGIWTATYKTQNAGVFTTSLRVKDSNGSTVAVWPELFVRKK